MKTFDSLTGDLDDETELAADWFPASAGDAKCAMDPAHILCFDKENALLRHAVLGKQVRFDALMVSLKEKEGKRGREEGLGTLHEGTAKGS